MNNSDISKLKVYHIISGDLWAGAESMAFNLLSQLRSYPNLHLVIILLNEGILAEKLREIGMAVHVIDEKRFSFFEICQRVRNIVRTDPPDIIHSHRYKENILAFLGAAFNRNIALIVTQHGLPEIASENATFLNRLTSELNFYLLSQCFTRIVTVSEDVKTFLITKYAFSGRHIESINNGIKIPNTAVPMKKSGKFVIGSSGRLTPVKDYPLMVEIARVIGDSNGQAVQFELAGEGPERPVLESLIKRYGLLERFVLKGHQKEMDSFYSGIDVYVNTSIHEGLPMTILEALASGVPVIAPAVGGITEIITNGVDGFLIEGRNPDAFAEKCLLLRENSELREKMSKAARERAASAFSAEKMAGKYYRLYCRTRPPTIQCQESDAVSWAR